LDYEKAYKILFNAATDAITEIEGETIKSQETVKGAEILKKAQLQTEEMYIKAGDPA
jgi:ribosomal protein L4